MKVLTIISMLVALAGGLVMGSAAAQDFKGRTITVYIPVGPGGGFDAYGRMLAGNIGKHLTGNPTVVATNMPGGGGRKLGNYLYNVAPKDGSNIAIIQISTVYDAAFGSKGVRFNSSKFNWLGSMAGYTPVAFAWSDTGIGSIEDARKKQIIMGATGRGGTTYQYCMLLNNMFGTKFKVVSGYKGAKGIYLAVEQREADGACALTWTVTKTRQAHWIRDNKIKVFLQLALEKHPELANVPLITDYAKTAEEKQVLQFLFGGVKMARPFLAPPGLPKRTVAALRKAFIATSKDGRLHEEARRRRFALDPIDGEAVQKIVDGIYNAPKALKAMAKAALTGNK
jgi:tripartite-type tricarboxylate transporter receptor subunit TctC